MLEHFKSISSPDARGYDYTCVCSHRGIGRGYFSKGLVYFFSSWEQSHIIVADSHRMGQMEKDEQTRCFHWCKTGWKGYSVLVTKEMWIL